MRQENAVPQIEIQNLAANIIKIYDISIPILDIDNVVRKIGGRVIKDKKAGTFTK